LPLGFDNVFIGFNVDADGNGFSDSTDLNDLIDHTGGSGMIEGGLGVDELLFFDRAENYIIMTTSGITRIIGKSTAEAPYANQEVVLYGVEQIRFVDRMFPISGDGMQQTQTPQHIFDFSNDLLLTGTIQDDVIDHLGGEDWIDGLSGVDEVLFFDNIANYTVRTLAGVTHLIGNSSAAAPYNGFEVVLFNVETLVFDDAELPLAPVLGNLILGTADNEQLTGSISGDVIDHMGGSDFIDGSLGVDSVLFFDSLEHFRVTTLNNVTRILGLDTASEAYRGFEVTLVNVEHFLFSETTLSPTSSIITGTDDHDVIRGTINNDIIDPLASSAWIDGGAGTDTVLIYDKLNNFEFWTLYGVTWMWGITGLAKPNVYEDFVYVFHNVEKIQFADGIKTLPTESRDVITGMSDEGTENITGTAGNDIIDHIAGNDRINGGAGNDVVLFFDDFANFEVTNLAGRFKVVATDAAHDMYAGDEVIIDNVETIAFLDRTVSINDTIPGINIDIFGTETSGSELISGTEGNNNIDHLGGSDRINGGSGLDTLLYFDSSDNYTVLTLTGVTHVLGGADALGSYANTEVILVKVENLLFTDHTLSLATSTQPIIFGLNAGGTEPLTATAGNDVIDHLGGSDNIDGGTGFDTLLFFDSIANYTVTKLAGVTHVIANNEAKPLYSGTDSTLLNIERLMFIDGIIDNSITSGTVDNDLLANSSLSETFDGGGGVDIVSYSGAKSDYTLTQTSSGYLLSRGTAESDVLLNVERLRFADLRLAIDLDDGEAAANTVRMLGAAFGSASVNNETYVGIGLSLFDDGWTMDQVADLIVGLDGFEALNNRQFAQTVCSNIGFADVNFAEQMLNLGVERSDLLRAAAEYYTNDLSINIIGLRQTGVEYAEYVG
jgi:Ca2+-binding RTX toxin-like protein